MAQPEPPPIVLSGCDLVRSEVSKYDGWDVNVMTAIAEAESGCVSKSNLSRAETHKGYDGSVICVGSYGVLQVGCVHHQQNPEALNDVALNVQVAHKVWQNQGYKAWTMYTNGRYLRFL